MEYNYAPLSDTLTSEDVKAYKASVTAKKAGPPKLLIIGFIIAVSLMVILVMCVLVIGTLINGAIDGPSLVIFAIGAAIAATFFIARNRLMRIHARLFKFALLNNLTLITDVFEPQYSGIVFNQGSNRIIKEALYFPGVGEIGNYSYVTGSGKSKSTHYWTYLRTKLVRKLPHMVLDSRDNNMFGSTFSNLPQSLAGNEVMKLEGDFNDHFTLYVPEGYERDALYVFTPDVMSALIDYGKNFDIEVIDDDLIFYANDKTKLVDESIIRQLLEMMKKVSSEIVEQGDYYADERVGNRAANTIAKGGERLKTNIGVGALIIIILIFACIGWITFSAVVFE